jgi:hypothetical protein
MGIKEFILCGLKTIKYCTPWVLRLYAKSSLTLIEWRFNLSFPWVSVLFLNSRRVSVAPYYVTTKPTNQEPGNEVANTPAIQKLHWHSREAQIEPPLFECDRAVGIQALSLYKLKYEAIVIGVPVRYD